MVSRTPWALATAAVLLPRAAQSWCPEGCCETTCGECTTSKGLDTVGCVWCPQTGKCHNFGSLVSDECTVPINTFGQCWGELCPLQIGGLLEGRPDAIEEWAKTTLASVGMPLHAFPTYASQNLSGIYDLATGEMLSDASEGSAVVAPLKLGIAADWGSGTCESAAVAALIEAERPDYTIHLGDTYYAGTESDCRTNFMGEAPNARQRGVAWPKGSTGTFALNGNHEMISGGSGLMETIFPYTGQHATYMALQSDRWRIIGLDSGYNCYERNEDGTRKLVKVKGGIGVLPETKAPQPEEIVRWLNTTVRIGDPTDTRGIVIMTHHQPISDWEKTIYEGTTLQLEQLLPAGKDVLWLFGHEHRFAIYDPVVLPGTQFRTFPRMIGHGGFADAMTLPGQGTDGLAMYDGRTYQEVGNDFNVLGKTKVGFNGHAIATVERDELTISYYTVKCLAEDCQTGVSSTDSTLMLREVFTVGSAGGLTMRGDALSEVMTVTSTDGPVPQPTTVAAAATGAPSLAASARPTAGAKAEPTGRPIAGLTGLRPTAAAAGPPRSIELYVGVGAGALVGLVAATALAAFWVRRRRSRRGAKLLERRGGVLSVPAAGIAP